MGAEIRGAKIAATTDEQFAEIEAALFRHKMIFFRGQDLTGPLPEDMMRKVDGSIHPLVRTHPRTGEKGLYCDRTYAVGIEGMTEDESAAILGFLVAHVTQPAFTCRLRWEPRTFVIWDNRLCVHQAFNDHDGFRRELYRTTIAGETPT